MAPAPIVWRERLILFTGWVAVLFTAAAAWAFAPIDAETGRPTTIQGHLATGLLLTLFLLPPAFLVVSRGRLLGARLGRLAQGFTDPRTFHLLLTGFAAGQVLRFLDRDTPSLLLIALILAMTASILLWLFHRRREVDTKAVILTGIWCLALIMAREMVVLFPGRVDFIRASWPTRALVVYHVGLLACLAVTPLLLLNRRLAAWAGALANRTSKASARLMIPLLVMSGLCLLAGQWSDDQNPRLILLTRASLLAVTTVGAWMAASMPTPMTSARRDRLPDISRRTYVLFLSAISTGYVILALSMQSDAINPDGLSYLTIARSYAEGNPVVRGYWSPLISWLLAPAIAMGMDAYAAFRGLVQLAGLALILTTTVLAERAGLNRTGRLFVALAIAMTILTRDFYLVTPDLLAAVVVTLYFSVLTHPGFLERPVAFGLVAGVLGALAYFAKYYNLPFFVAHFLLSGALLWLHGRKRGAIARATVSGVGAFLIISVPWILALSGRYGQLTVTTTAAISHATIGPGSNGHQCWRGRLCIEPEDVLFPWEDPQPQYYSAYGWSPFDNLESFRHQIQFLWQSISHWLEEPAYRLGRLPSVVLLVLALGLLMSWQEVEQRLRFSWAALTLIVHTAGYMLGFSEFRYFLSTLPILWIASYCFLQVSSAWVLIHQAEWGKGTLRLIRLLVCVVPLFSFTWLAPLAEQLQYQANPCLRPDAETAASLLVAPIAGTDAVVNHIAYYTRVRTVGVVPDATPASEADLMLRDAGVRTFLAASHGSLANTLASRYDYVTIGQIQVCDLDFTILSIP